jgi:hypothetical protein
MYVAPNGALEVLGGCEPVIGVIRSWARDPNMSNRQEPRKVTNEFGDRSPAGASEN